MAIQPTKGRKTVEISMNEEQIRQDERRKMAQKLLTVLDSAHRRLTPGLWYAATILDPSVNDSGD